MGAGGPAPGHQVRRAYSLDRDSGCSRTQWGSAWATTRSPCQVVKLLTEDHRDDKGQVTLRPKNFYTKHKDKGHHGGVFSRTGYISIGDDFKDFQGNSYLRGGAQFNSRMHHTDFRPSGATPKAPNFQHYKEFDDKTFDTRDNTGRLASTHPPGCVKTGLKNFTTAPNKKGTGNYGLFGRNLYALDPFERAEDLTRDERLQHYSKIPTRFSTTIAPKPTFDNAQQTFAGDDKMPPVRKVG